jgi:uncharacterized membrane protein
MKEREGKGLYRKKGAVRTQEMKEREKKRDTSVHTVAVNERANRRQISEGWKDLDGQNCQPRINEKRPKKIKAQKNTKR